VIPIFIALSETLADIDGRRMCAIQILRWGLCATVSQSVKKAVST